MHQESARLQRERLTLSYKIRRPEVGHPGLGGGGLVVREPGSSSLCLAVLGEAAALSSRLDGAGAPSVVLTLRPAQLTHRLPRGSTQSSLQPISK